MSRRKRFTSYAEKLRDRRWQQKRLEILKRDGFCCQYPQCPSEHTMLEVHHKAYLRNTDPWDYPDYALITYCHAHHEIEQDRMEAAHLAIARNPMLIQHCIQNGGLISNPVITRPKKEPMTIEEAKELFNQMRRNALESK